MGVLSSLFGKKKVKDAPSIDMSAMPGVTQPENIQLIEIKHHADTRYDEILKKDVLEADIFTLFFENIAFQIHLDVVHSELQQSIEGGHKFSKALVRRNTDNGFVELNEQVWRQQIQQCLDLIGEFENS